MFSQVSTFFILACAATSFAQQCVSTRSCSAFPQTSSLGCSSAIASRGLKYSTCTIWKTVVPPRVTKTVVVNLPTATVGNTEAITATIDETSLVSVFSTVTEYSTTVFVEEAEVATTVTDTLQFTETETATSTLFISNFGFALRKRAATRAPCSTSRPAKPYKPAAKPYKPAAKPYKPAAKPYKPAAKPYKPAAKPAKPAAKPYKPAAKPSNLAVPATLPKLCSCLLTKTATRTVTAARLTVSTTTTLPRPTITKLATEYFSVTVITSITTVVVDSTTIVETQSSTHTVPVTVTEQTSVTGTETITATVQETVYTCVDPNRARCGNYCYRTQLDWYNCGGCGQRCNNGQVCNGGRCIS